MAHEFCWMELTTEDAQTAKSFYGKLFDWNYDEMDMAQGGKYSMFQPKAGGPGGGIMARPTPECPTAWTPYVTVEDLEASVAKVTELGGKVLVGPTEVPGHGFFSMIADPTGGALGLWKCNSEKK